MNSAGERFFNEADDYTQFTLARDQQDRVISIFDQTIADLDVIKGDVGCAATWGMYTVCDTLEEVAEAFDIDYEGLQKTVDAYAAAYDGGEDEFGKGAAYLRTNMKNPPYYAVDTLIENHTTYGSINTSADTHLLGADSNPIPGLFAAGECTNKKTYMLGNAGACIYEGRLAVQTFLAEK